MVQEAALSSRNTCCVGALNIGLDEILRVVGWLRHKWHHIADDIKDPVGSIFPLFNWADRQHGLFGSGLRSPEAMDLLIDLRAFHAFDRRDHVFAILGLLQKHTGSETPVALAADYNASLATVLHPATKYIVQEREHLEVLRFVTHRAVENNEDDIASWAPSQHVAWDGAVDTMGFQGLWHNASAGRKFVTQQLNDEPSILRTTGIAVDSVQNLGTVWRLASRRDYSIVQLIAEADALVAGTSAGVANRNAFAAMVLCAGTTESLTNYQEAEAGAACLAYTSLKEQWLALPDDELEPWAQYLSRNDKSATSFAQALANASHNRMVFKTTSRYVGLGPQTTRKDDIVAILYGSRWPVVLREFEQYPGDYEFVGTCYMYGIMNGEAVHEHEASGKEVETFRLR